MTTLAVLEAIETLLLALARQFDKDGSNSEDEDLRSLYWSVGDKLADASELVGIAANMMR